MNASIFSKLPPEEITALHQSWKNDPLSVDPLWAAWFDGYELGSGGAPREKENAGNAADTSPYTVPPESAERRGRVNQLIRAYRVMGHQCARFNPLDPPDQTGCPVNPEDMGFREEDMDQPVNIGTFMDGGTFTLREIITRLQKIYCGAIGFEYHHIDNLKIAPALQCLYVIDQLLNCFTVCIQRIITDNNQAVYILYLFFPPIFLTSRQIIL